MPGHAEVRRLNPVTRCRSKYPADLTQKVSCSKNKSGYNFDRSSGRQPQQQWKFQQHWKQRQLVVFYGELINKCLETKPELQQRRCKP